MSTHAGSVSTQVLNAPCTPSRTFSQNDVMRAFSKLRERAHLGRRELVPSPAGSAVLESFCRSNAAEIADGDGESPAAAAGACSSPGTVAARRKKPDVPRKFCVRNQFGQ